MGRTLPAVTQVIFKEIAEVKSLYQGLRRSDQFILDGIFESVIQHKAALANAGSLLPLESMLFLMLLEQQKKIDSIYNLLHQTVQDMKSNLIEPPQLPDPKE